MYIRTQDLINSKESAIAKKESNDCVVYAFASAFELDYDTAHAEVAKRFNRQAGKGTKRSHILEGVKQLQAGDQVNGKTITEVITKPTTNYKAYGQVVPRQVRLSSFAAKYPKGTYMVLVRSHAITIKDGMVVDSARPHPSSIVLQAFKVETV